MTGKSADRRIPYQVVIDEIRHVLSLFPVDEEWYRRTYPEADASIRRGEYEDAKEHFLTTGYFEGNLPSPAYLVQ